MRTVWASVSLSRRCHCRYLSFSEGLTHSNNQRIFWEQPFVKSARYSCPSVNIGICSIQFHHQFSLTSWKINFHGYFFCVCVCVISPRLSQFYLDWKWKHVHHPKYLYLLSSCTGKGDDSQVLVYRLAPAVDSFTQLHPSTVAQPVPRKHGTLFPCAIFPSVVHLLEAE